VGKGGGELRELRRLLNAGTLWVVTEVVWRLFGLVLALLLVGLLCWLFVGLRNFVY